MEKDNAVRRGRPRDSRRGGFTLIEVLIALFVIVVGMLPIATLTVACRRQDQQAQVQSVAFQIAWKELETLRSQSVTNRGTTAQSSFPIPASATQNYAAFNLAGAYSITPVPTIGDSTHVTQLIAVDVSWTNALSRASKSSERVSAYVTQGAGA